MAGFRKLPGTEEIEWSGRRYRRQPEHTDRHRRVYFMATTAPRTYLHRDLYVAHQGTIPDGFHVHHSDHDPLNNDPSNLVAVDEFEHLSYHGQHQPTWLARCEQCGDDFTARRAWSRWCSARCKQAMRRAEGTAYQRPPKGPWIEPRTCEECGTGFIAKRPWARFCKSACKQRAGRAQKRMEMAG